MSSGNAQAMSLAEVLMSVGLDSDMVCVVGVAGFADEKKGEERTNARLKESLVFSIRLEKSALPHFLFLFLLGVHLC